MDSRETLVDGVYGKGGSEEINSYRERKRDGRNTQNGGERKSRDVGGDLLSSFFLPKLI